MILNELVILDKMILGEIFRDMNFVEFHELSRALLEKIQKLDFGIVISKIMILKKK